MLYELDSTVPKFPPQAGMAVHPRRNQALVRGVSLARTVESTLETMEAVRMRWDATTSSGTCRSSMQTRRYAMWSPRRLSDGATDIVFLTVFLTDSDHTAEADDMDEAMGLGERGSEPFGPPCSGTIARLARMIADKVVAAAGDRDRSSVGVMLVGHGQPHEWDLMHPTETEQEQAFRVGGPRASDRGWIPRRDGLRRLDELPRAESPRSCARAGRDAVRGRSSASRSRSAPTRCIRSTTRPEARPPGSPRHVARGHRRRRLEHRAAARRAPRRPCPRGIEALDKRAEDDLGYFTLMSESVGACESVSTGTSATGTRSVIEVVGRTPRTRDRHSSVHAVLVSARAARPR